MEPFRRGGTRMVTIARQYLHRSTSRQYDNIRKAYRSTCIRTEQQAGKFWNEQTAHKRARRESIRQVYGSTAYHRFKISTFQEFSVYCNSVVERFSVFSKSTIQQFSGLKVA